MGRVVNDLNAVWRTSTALRYPMLWLSAGPRRDVAVNETHTTPELAIRAAFRSRLVPKVKSRACPASHCDTERPARCAECGPPQPGKRMPISFSSPVTRDGRLRGAGVTAVLGPTNTGKTHLAIERMLGAFVRHDRAAAAAAGARGLQQGRRAGRRRKRRADHRRGKDQAAEPALLGGDRRGDAARSRSRLRRHRRSAARRRSRPRPCLHRPHAQPPRPRGNAGARRRDGAADGRAAAARRQHRAAARGCRRSFTPATRSSRGCRGAAPSSRSRPTRSMPSPN